ncbi:hypothetical protein IAS59_000043 [Cryptococcus gattii]
MLKQLWDQTDPLPYICKEQADFNEVQSLEDEPSHGSQSTGLNSAEDIHPSNSGSLAEGQAAVSMVFPVEIPQAN